MKITQDAIDLIAHFEGCRLKAYRCPAGILTIGFGHTGPDVTPGMTISMTHARALLQKDLAKFTSAVDGLVKVELTSGQYDALVSFAYNLGAGALAKSTLLKLVNASRFDAAAGEFGKWVNANGQRLRGLVRRRAAEAQLFRTSKLDLSMEAA